MSYRPLHGVRVLDLGILIPAALTGARLAQLGADVVKVEQRGRGDRIRYIPDFIDGASRQFMSHMWGRRSIELDLRDRADRTVFDRLAGAADVLLENQLPGSWARLGLDFEELHRQHPSLVICSITGFGQTGPLGPLPSHGLNMDAAADGIPVTWEEGHPHLGWYYTSWGNELGSGHAATAICAALLHARATGEGAWIDISCWDAIVETHRAEIASTWRGAPANQHQKQHAALYDTYRTSDGRPFLVGLLEPKFWRRFCAEVGRPDLVGLHGGGDLEFGVGDDSLAGELAAIIATATAEEWRERFLAWDLPGSPVLEIPDVMRLEHFAARGIVEGERGDWPNVASPIRWHHVDERAGLGLQPPPELGADMKEILADWLA
jgi:crotonobetainyl-CoA:carnitine CoA-transferase CaiB-like acyl-CoA transferase